MGENRSSFCFFPSQVRKIGKNNKEARGVKISGPNTLKQRGKEYKGDYDMEKDSSRLLILVLQNNPFLSISCVCDEIFLFLTRVLAIKRRKIHLTELDFRTK